MKVKEILDFLGEKAPFDTCEEWDNVGLLVGSGYLPVTRVLVALDVTDGALEAAKAVGADLIVTHHPMIFQALKAVTDETSIGRGIMELCRHGISAVNAHTNLDCAPGGVNDTLAAALRLKEIAVVNPSGLDAEGREWGLLRSGYTEETTLPAFLAHVKQALGCQGLRYTDGGKPVHKVAVGGGSCAGGMLEALDAGCDTFVTADIKYNQFWDAKDLGLNLIDAGHFHTENPVVAVLAAKIAAAFPEVEVKISKTHADCMKFF